MASFAATAQPELSTAQITERVQAKARQYADALTCVDQAAPDPVLRSYLIGSLQPYQLDTTDPAEFVGFWYGDMGCAGGSGTVMYHLVNIKTDAQGRFYVDAHASEPAIAIEGLNQRFIKRVVGASLDDLTLEGMDFADGDANNFPSVVYRYGLKRDDSGNWRVVSRKEIGREQY